MIREKLEPVTVVMFLPLLHLFGAAYRASPAGRALDYLASRACRLLVVFDSRQGRSKLFLLPDVSGQDHASAMAIGALMNARGLMELIVINIGMQRGIIEQDLFSMLVLMAIVTTLMASPIFELVYGRAARKNGRL